ncbi:MAG TPA: hypothetical protein PLJ23_10505 [Gemmatimonadales bacterium]|jgi:hypothetical protein|nr:hypothetical protein [Gemmatimonadales bacterium]
MKIAVVVPVALILGLGLGTGVGMMMHPTEVPAAEGDSTGHSAPDSTTTAEPPKPSEPAHAEPKGDSGATPAVVTPPVAAPAATPPASADAQRMAKIFERLAAQDAGALVADMTDVELEAVLRAMDASKAGDLIAALPKARGATLTKRLLSPAGKP